MELFWERCAIKFNLAFFTASPFNGIQTRESHPPVKKATIILLVAHGSRLAEANVEVHRLADQLQQRLNHDVRACFLEGGEPNIPDAIDQALQQGAKEILALPYFLTQGRHFREDIPKILGEKARAFPETSIRLLDYVGSHEGMMDLLLQIIKESG